MTGLRGGPGGKLRATSAAVPGEGQVVDPGADEGLKFGVGFDLAGDAHAMFAAMGGDEFRAFQRGLKRAFKGGRKALQGGGGLGQVRLGGAGCGNGFRQVTRHRPDPCRSAASRR